MLSQNQKPVLKSHLFLCFCSSLFPFFFFLKQFAFSQFNGDQTLVCVRITWRTWKNIDYCTPLPPPGDSDLVSLGMKPENLYY